MLFKQILLVIKKCILDASRIRGMIFSLRAYFALHNFAVVWVVPLTPGGGEAMAVTL